MNYKCTPSPVYYGNLQDKQNLKTNGDGRFARHLLGSKTRHVVPHFHSHRYEIVMWRMCNISQAV